MYVRLVKEAEANLHLVRVYVRYVKEAEANLHLVRGRRERVLGGRKLHKQYRG